MLLLQLLQAGLLGCEMVAHITHSAGRRLQVTIAASWPDNGDAMSRLRVYLDQNKWIDLASVGRRERWPILAMLAGKSRRVGTLGAYRASLGASTLRSLPTRGGS